MVTNYSRSTPVRIIIEAMTAASFEPVEHSCHSRLRDSEILRDTVDGLLDLAEVSKRTVSQE